MPTTTLMTIEEFLALPDDPNVERWLINGELRERPMTLRNRFHCYSMTRIARFLDTWLDEQPQPRGQILTGDAGVRLKEEPGFLFGVDVVYFAADVLTSQSGESTIVEGIPTLAVEILSPSDTIEEVNEKIDAFLNSGVPLVWILDPHRRTVTVHRPGHEPALATVRQELTAEVLPGFRVVVGKLFE
jgi:Uma2 family endonuclease